MKKILLFVVILMVMCGCVFKEPSVRRVEVDTTYNGKLPTGMRVLVIDSCEYIDHTGGLAHKGNCKYCEERGKR